jgi:hypothetical protein
VDAAFTQPTPSPFPLPDTGEGPLIAASRSQTSAENEKREEERIKREKRDRIKAARAAQQVNILAHAYLYNSPGNRRGCQLTGCCPMWAQPQAEEERKERKTRLDKVEAKLKDTICLTFTKGPMRGTKTFFGYLRFNDINAAAPQLLHRAWRLLDRVLRVSELHIGEWGGAVVH